MGTLVLVVALAVPAVYASVRLVRCASARQCAGELARALAVALLLVMMSFTFGLIPAGEWWNAWLAQHGKPVSTAGVVASAILSFVVPLRLLAIGMRWCWLGSWNFPYPLETPPRSTEDGMPPEAVASAVPGSRFAGEVVRLAAWACLLFGGIGSLLVIVGLGDILKPDGNTVWMAVLPLTLTAVSVGHMWMESARSHLGKVLPATAEVAAGSYVLYLRPFSVDGGRAMVPQAMFVGSHPVAGLIETVMTSQTGEQ